MVPVRFSMVPKSCFRMWPALKAFRTWFVGEPSLEWKIIFKIPWGDSYWSVGISPTVTNKHLMSQETADAIEAEWAGIYN